MKLWRGWPFLSVLNRSMLQLFENFSCGQVSQFLSRVCLHILDPNTVLLRLEIQNFFSFALLLDFFPHHLYLQSWVFASLNTYQVGCLLHLVSVVCFLCNPLFPKCEEPLCCTHRKHVETRDKFLDPAQHSAEKARTVSQLWRLSEANTLYRRGEGRLLRTLDSPNTDQFLLQSWPNFQVENSITLVKVNFDVGWDCRLPEANSVKRLLIWLSFKCIFGLAFPRTNLIINGKCNAPVRVPLFCSAWIFCRESRMKIITQNND